MHVNKTISDPAMHNGAVSVRAKTLRLLRALTNTLSIKEPNSITAIPSRSIILSHQKRGVFDATDILS